jgi:filamentous hemagglutinin family protein
MFRKFKASNVERRASSSPRAWGAIMASLLLFAGTSLANPLGEQVVAGSASFNRDGSTLQITTSDRAIINWQDFSISTGELARFIQPSSSSAVLNRVVSGNPSSLMGSLQANGKVYLINPNGILIGAGARIDCASFVASTLDVANDQFMKGGDLNFAGHSTAAIQNLGAINAIDGNVFLIARQVENSGTMRAPNGTVGLAAGQEVMLMTDGDQRLSVKVSNLKPQASSPESPSSSRDGVGIQNAGVIEAAQAELKASGNLYALAVNNGGLVRATGAVQKEGRIVLSAGTGSVRNDGTLRASNGQDGGKVVMQAGDVVNGGTLDVSGENGGQATVSANTLDHSGAITADGGMGSGGSILLKTRDWLRINPDGKVTANAGRFGNGGQIKLWSDGRTGFWGGIEARGGNQGGDGGLVEVSGAEMLLYRGQADLSAPMGNGGRLLLDPKNLTIISGAGGTCAPDQLFSTSPSASETVSDSSIATILNGGVSVTLEANNDLTVNAGVTIAPATSVSLNHESLTLRAGRSIKVGSGAGPAVQIATQGRDVILEANSAGAVAGQRSAGAGSIVMANNATIDVGSGNLTLAIKNGPSTGGSITLAKLVVGGNLAVFSEKGGAVLSLSGIEAHGVSDFSTGSGNFDLLLNQANQFDGTVRLNVGRNATLNNTVALDLGTVTVGKNLTVTAPGISQSGTIQVVGDSSFDGQNGAINLGLAGNSFGGTLKLINQGNNNVTVAASSAIDLGSVNVGSGTLTVTTDNQDITQSGAIVQAAGAGTVTIDAGNAAIDLSPLSQDNQITGAISLNNQGSHDVTLENAVPTVLAESNVGGGTLTVTVTGDNPISQTGPIAQESGATAEFSTTGGAGITLTDPNNNFTGTVTAPAYAEIVKNSTKPGTPPDPTKPWRSAARDFTTAANDYLTPSEPGGVLFAAVNRPVNTAPSDFLGALLAPDNSNPDSNLASEMGGILAAAYGELVLPADSGESNDGSGLVTWLKRRLR